MGPVTDEHKLTYHSNVALAVQQMTSQFERGFMYVSGLAGRQAQVLDLIGATEAEIDGARGGDTPNIDNQTEPVWMRPRQIEWGKVIEKEDAIKALTDFASPFVQAGAKAVVRAKDSILAGSIFAPRVIGQDGTTVQAYDNTNKVVTVGIGAGAADDVTATGMNVRKFVRGLRLLQAQQVDIDMEEKVAWLNAQEMEELYRDLTYVNKDYREKAVLEGKQVRSILDIEIIPSERLPNYDGNTHIAALACRSGLSWGEFSPLVTKAEPNPAKKYRIHPYMETWIGATRTEDAKVIQILNKK